MQKNGLTDIAALEVNPFVTNVTEMLTSARFLAVNWVIGRMLKNTHNTQNPKNSS